MRRPTRGRCWDMPTVPRTTTRSGGRRSASTPAPYRITGRCTREADAAEYGYGAVVAPPTFLSIPAMLANRRLFERVITGYDVYVQTDQVFEFHRPVVAGDAS